MAAGPHTFVLVDVFASERYLGNQLAIVSVRSNALTYQQKHQIAKEFNHPTTAFLHDGPHPYQPRKLELFSPKGERDFAADAVLGTAQYIFQCLMTSDDAVALPSPNIAAGNKPGAKLSKSALQTKAGVIQAYFDPARQVAAIEVPFDLHVHGKETPKDEILAVQRKLGTSPHVDKMKASYSVVSIHKGVTFTLVDFTTSPALISLLRPGEAPEPNLDAGWRAAKSTGNGATTPTTTTPPSLSSPPSFCGAVYFIQLQTDFTEEPYITRLEVRVIADGVEEAASASGCCALAAHLAMQKGGKGSRHAYAIEQGIEMGRRSQLCIEVRLNEQGTGVSRITLSGRATMVMEGRLL
ncbi:predicted protein [Uncinocarpus reesii 1704]|uniref:Phenazine biosynthesis protein n=1 Tax=Uncinocarpus reesii (strain UAMH 1704) TaxID=336963 RepID=C4JW69_UNCRE|nr:uncharacterized protein UREG_06811 [Uncinocarpus reesii 1704]EEP81946.1 predicted protein [Uncinocarpus reesii 1704]